jgi:hypothetical protein
MKSWLTDKCFWIKTAERVIKTFFQALGASVGTDAVGLLDLDWGNIFNLSGTAALLSLVTCIVSANIGTTKNDPGLT